MTMLDLNDPDWRRRLEEASGPVIAVGGPPDAGLAALEAGADDWLPAPDPAELSLALAKAEARRRGRDSDALCLRRRTVSRVSRVVGHEINNSLSALLMYDGLLLEQLRPGAPGRDAAEGMSEATQRAASLVRVLLSCDRPGPARPRAVDLNRMLRERWALLRLVLGQDVQVELELASDLPPVRSDAARLEEALLTVAVALEGQARALTLHTAREAEGGVRLTLWWEGPPMSTRPLRLLRERLEEMEARLLATGELPRVEILLPEAR